MVICVFHAPFTPVTRGRKIFVMRAEHRAHLCYLGATENGKSKKEIEQNLWTETNCQEHLG
jgi:hypothetical protein